VDDLRAFQEIKKYDNGDQKLVSDLIIREISFNILINNHRLVTISALPADLQELGVGFLFSEGLISNYEEIEDILLDPAERAINFNLNIPDDRVDDFHATGERTSGCGSSLSSAISDDLVLKFPELEIEAEVILKIMKEFINSSRLFRETGGVHIAGLVKNGSLEYFAEDIGRHNAFDKVAGKGLADKEDLSKFSLICSGRISSEIVKKAVRLRIPLIISKSAPTSEAIRLGWDYKVYIIGFARNKRMNIYTGFTDLVVK
jgi:FdhD protein